MKQEIMCTEEINLEGTIDSVIEKLVQVKDDYAYATLLHIAKSNHNLHDTPYVIEVHRLETDDEERLREEEERDAVAFQEAKAKALKITNRKAIENAILRMQEQLKSMGGGVQ